MQVPPRPQVYSSRDYPLLREPQKPPVYSNGFGFSPGYHHFPGKYQVDSRENVHQNWSTRSNSDSNHSVSRSDSVDKEAFSHKKLQPKAKKEPLPATNTAESSTHNTYRMKFKTELCKNFELQGSCRWGDTCCYAHGPQELRNKTHLNANYKSKICKHFHGTGACPYGLR
jgi:hypothetical protein